MKKRKIVYFIIAVIAIPIAIDWLVFSNAFPSHITNEAWAGFLGSYIGGLCTMAAVFITISDNNKKIKEQEKQRKLQQEEEKRLNIRPYLDTRYTYFERDVKIGDNDRIFDIENEHTSMVHFDISPSRRKQIEINNRIKDSRLLCVDYIISNVGAGSAINMVATINNFKENMAIARDETVRLLCIIYIRDNTPSDLKIKLTYSDVEERGRYEKEEIIHIDIDKNGELVSRMLKREQQKTVEISKKEVNGDK